MLFVCHTTQNKVYLILSYLTIVSDNGLAPNRRQATIQAASRHNSGWCLKCWILIDGNFTEYRYFHPKFKHETKKNFALNRWAYLEYGGQFCLAPTIGMIPAKWTNKCLACWLIHMRHSVSNIKTVRRGKTKPCPSYEAYEVLHKITPGNRPIWTRRQNEHIQICIMNISVLKSSLCIHL